MFADFRTPKASLLFVALIVVQCTTDSPPRSPFGGHWVAEKDGQTLMVLSLAEGASDAEGAEVGLTGTFARPRSFEVSSEGVISDISEDRVALEASATFSGSGTFDLAITDPTMRETLVVSLVEDDRLEVRPYGMPEWMRPLEFVRAELDEAPAIEWRAPILPPDIAAVRDELVAMAEEDQSARTGPIAGSRIDELALGHRPALERIHDRYGWPYRSVFGTEAAQAFALLVQHQATDLQERLLPDLEMAVARREASPQDLAMLEDELAVRAGRDQRWGTEVSCVDGEPVLAPVADPEGLADRRRRLYLPPIDDYLELMRVQCGNVVEKRTTPLLEGTDPLRSDSVPE